MTPETLAMLASLPALIDGFAAEVVAANNRLRAAVEEMNGLRQSLGIPIGPPGGVHVIGTAVSPAAVATQPPAALTPAQVEANNKTAERLEWLASQKAARAGLLDQFKRDGEEADA